jgi:hypothetical protein
MHKPVVVTAADYFAILEIQKPNASYPKHDGEPGRRPGGSHKGYVLADVLAWPMEVYKEVQVSKYILSVTCTDDVAIVNYPQTCQGRFACCYPLATKGR